MSKFNIDTMTTKHNSNTVLQLAIEWNERLEEAVKFLKKEMIVDILSISMEKIEIVNNQLDTTINIILPDRFYKIVEFIKLKNRYIKELQKILKPAKSKIPKRHSSQFPVVFGIAIDVDDLGKKESVKC